jgi:hypothetical protein
VSTPSRITRAPSGVEFTSIIPVVGVVDVHPAIKVSTATIIDKIRIFFFFIFLTSLNFAF